MTRAIIDKSSLIRVPVHVADMRGRVSREEGLHYTKTGEWPSKESLMERVGVTEEKLNAIKTNTKMISLDAPVSGQDQDSSTSLLDILQAENGADPEAIVDQETYEKEVSDLLEALSPTEVLIVRWRFSIGHRESLTLQEIADKFDLSRERIRQIEARALQKMRDRVRRKRMRPPFRDTGGG
jgi:RNA polymerase primary sigma factor